MRIPPDPSVLAFVMDAYERAEGEDPMLHVLPLLGDTVDHGASRVAQDYLDRSEVIVLAGEAGAVYSDDHGNWQAVSGLVAPVVWGDERELGVAFAVWIERQLARTHTGGAST